MANEQHRGGAPNPVAVKSTPTKTIEQHSTPGFGVSPDMGRDTMTRYRGIYSKHPPVDATDEMPGF